MRVRIVSYEEPDSWILGKFARNLCDELRLLGEDADVARVPDQSADINHHIIYIDYELSHNPIDTLMVTHIDAHWKLRKLREQLRHAAAAVCMSSDTVRSLESAGLPSGKLCYVNPAHDGLITPRPLKVGIASRLYPDGRKREELLLRTAKRLEPSLFSFAIMGEGWDEIVARLCETRFTVEYHPDFNPTVYREMIRSLDYYLYLGMDEGSMGFVDAVAAGVATIVTRQGYHLDAPGGLTHPFESEEELAAIFERIATGRRSIVQSVASWTWRDYAIKHLQIWGYLKNGTVPATFSYPDGIASLLDEGSLPGIAYRCKTEFGYLRQSIRSLLAAQWERKRGGA